MSQQIGSLLNHPWLGLAKIEARTAEVGLSEVQAAAAISASITSSPRELPQPAQHYKLKGRRSFSRRRKSEEGLRAGLQL